ncbi:MAG: ABC transporter permease [Bryobacteraceae bacterium]|jgi:predicted permease
MRMQHWLYTLPLRLRSLFRRDGVEQDLNDELQYHLEQKIQEYIAQGLTPEEARYAGLRAMDSLAQRQEECRETRGVNGIENTIRDIRYSVRTLRKSPGFTTVAVLTLALGIGANAVVFGILNALVLRPVNIPRAESFYGVQQQSGWPYQSYPDYVDLRDRNRSFDGLAGYNITAAGLDTGDNPSRAWLYEVTGNYFDVLGIQPYLGRFIHASDEHGPNSAPYVVLTYAYWHAHFGDDRGVVGRVVKLNKHPFTIVGVAPQEFHGTLLFFTPDFFVPLVNEEQLEGFSYLNDRGKRQVFQVMGHLKAGISPAQALIDLNSIGSWLEKTYPKEVGQRTFSLGRTGLPGDIFAKPVREFVTALMLLAGLILLAACANLGSLFAARASDRGREVALRLALGASRNRILRALFTEAALISLLGGAVGLWGSVALLRGLSVWQPMPRFPIHVPVTPDANVYGIALALALISGILFGLVPVRQVLRVDPYQIVKKGSTATLGRRVTVRDVLLVVQIAICAVLVTSSMVAVRGLARSLNGNFGFEPRNAMLVETNLSMAGYTGDGVPAIQKRMRDAVAGVPGVKSVALVDNPPLVEGWNIALVFTDKTTDLRPANAATTAVRYSMSPEYFDAAGTALLMGRGLSPHDDKNAPRVAVVNRLFASTIFGSSANALGAYYKMKDGTRVQVVGIVEDGRYTTNIAEDPQTAMFLPMLQSPSVETWLVVRSDRDPRQLGAALRSTLRDLDSGLPVYVQTWIQGMDGALFGTRVATVSLGVLGVMGAMLSITGIFGMAAYSVSKRLKELGIRIAIGAQPKEVLEAALGRALKLLAIGSAAGLALGVLASRVLAHIVYQATPRDPLVLGGVVVAMLLLGLMATWIPAQRALSLDPLTLLREE